MHPRRLGWQRVTSRTVTAAVVSLLLAAVSAGCGGSGGDEVTPAAARPEGRVVTPVSPGFTASGPLSAGGAEGGVPFPEAVTPPETEWLANGGKRFSPPFAGELTVADWFGSARSDGLIHGGVDLAAAAGAAVRSVCTGRVIVSDTDDAYGEHIIIDCGGGWTALFGYLGTRISVAGAAVTNATQVGSIDRELLFVHLELRWEGVPVDPTQFMRLGEPPPEPTAPPPPVRAGTAVSGATATPGAEGPATAQPPAATPPPTAQRAATSTPTRLPPTATRTARPPTPAPTDRPVIR
jgi:Peptidase family M23